MVGLTLYSSTDTNRLEVEIPDELIGKELQIIILPAMQEANQTIEFFTDAELKQLAAVNLSHHLSDDEDYTKW